MKLMIGVIFVLFVAGAAATSVDYGKVNWDSAKEENSIKIQNGPVNLTFEVGSVETNPHTYSSNSSAGNAQVRAVMFRNDAHRKIGDVEIMIYDRPVSDPVLVDEQCMEKLVEAAGGKNIAVNVTNILFAGKFPVARHLVSQDPWMKKPGYYISFKVAENAMVNIFGDPDSFEQMNKTMEFGGVDL